MSWLLDSSACIAFLRGRDAVIGLAADTTLATKNVDESRRVDGVRVELW